jgi:hypothetical protein
MEEETFQSAEEATRTEGEEDPVDRSDPTYCPPHISPHPCESYSTTRTPWTSGSMIWPKIRDLMKEIPAPVARQWDADDSRFNTGLKTGDRERLLNEVARERLEKAPSITGDGWQEAMETYIDCLPGRPQDTLIEDSKLNTTTPQLGIAYYNLGNLCRPSHLPDESRTYTRHMDHNKYDFRYNMLIKLLNRSPGTLIGVCEAEGLHTERVRGMMPEWQLVSFHDTNLCLGVRGRRPDVLRRIDP